MNDVNDDFSGVSSNSTRTGIIMTPTTISSLGSSVPSTGGLVSPPAFQNTTAPFYVPAGGGGGGGVSSVSGTVGQIVVTNGTTTPVISMASVGTAGVKSNVSSITTDAQGRVTSSTSLSYTPANPADFVPVTGGTFSGAVSGIAPTADANFATKEYVDSQIVIGGGVQSITAGDSSIALTGTSANPIIAVSTQAGVVPGAYTNANVTVDSKGVITAVSNGSAGGSLTAGKNIALDTTTTPGTTIINQDITSAINMNDNEINNCPLITSVVEGEIEIRGGEVNITQTGTGFTAPEVGFSFPTVMNLTAGGAIGISAGGAVGIGALGVVNMTAVGTASIFCTGVGSAGGEILLGGPVNHITIENDGTSITGVTDLSASGSVNCATGIASASYTAPLMNVGNASNFTSISNVGNGYLGINNSVTSSLPGGAGVIDTFYNPATLAVDGSTLSVSGKNALGASVEMGSVNLSTLQLFNKFPAEATPAPGSTVTLTASDAGSILSYKVTGVPSPGQIVTINLPSGVTVVPGMAFFIKNSPTSTTGLAVGFPGQVVSIAIGGGLIAIARSTNDYAISDTLEWENKLNEYVPLAGTAPGAPMTGTLVVDESTNIESKNITTSLISPIPTVGFVSILAPTQIEGGNFLIANPAGSEIGLASSATPAPGEIATIGYNFSVDDLVHVNKVLEAPGAILDGNDVVPLITFKDARTFYVSKQGNDSNDGSVLAPKLTVQSAVTAGLATGAECIIDIAPGTYTENVTIASTAGILLRGVLQSDRMIEGTILKGVIAIEVTGTDNLNNNQVVISGCFISGIVRDTSTKQHTLIVEGCRIEGDSADGGEAIDVNITSTDGRTFLKNCVMTQEAGSVGRNPVVQCNVGWLNIQDCDITARDDASAVIVNGSSFLVRLSGSTLASTSPSANPDALLQITSTSASTHAIAQTLFQYTSSTSKTSPAILASRSSAGVISATLANCIFALAGTLTAGNVVQFTPGTTCILAIADNRSTNTALAQSASQIQSGITVLPLTRVGETVVTSVNSASGALSVLAGTGVSVSTVGSNITVSATNNGTLTGVGAGTGISVDNTNPAVPVVTNTGVTQLIAGENISLTASTGVITISSTGGGGGGGAVDSVSAGTGITLTGTAQDVIVNNAGVLSVGVGSGLANTGTAQEPVIEIAPAGTITFDVVDANDIETTDLSSVNFPVVPGSALPTTDRELVPKIYVDSQSYGVQSVTAGDASIQIGGTPANPTVSIAVSGVTGGSYTNSSITVGADGRVTSATSGTAPVTSVSGTLGQITSTGGTTPVLSLTNAGTAGVYTFPSSVTTDTKGRVTAITSGTQPITEVNAGTGISVSGSLGSVTIANDGVLSVTAGDSSVSVGGTASDPTIELPNQTITPGPYAWGAITVDQKGIITAISENDVPFTEISAGTGISVSGTPGSATITNDGVTALNSNTGSVSLVGGTNVTIDDSVPGTITINASGGGGGGITSINSETGPDITIAGGSGISIATLANTITITNTGGGGGGGVVSVTGAPGGGIDVDNTDPANPVLSNAGVLTVNDFGGNIDLQNDDGFIGITETAGTPNEIVFSYNGLNNIEATNGSIVLTGTTGVRSIEAKPGGSAYADIDMIGSFALTKATKLNVNGPLSFLDIGGFANGYEMTGNDAGTEVGIVRNQIDTAEVIVPGTKALMFDEINYAPTSPFNPSSGFTPGPGGLFVSGTAKQIASQLITLTQANFPYANQEKYIGVSGTISFILSSAQPLSYLVRYRKNGGGLVTASGGVYYTSTQSVSVPVNGITWTGIGGNTFKVGDTITWELFATYTGITPPSILTAPTVFSAVFSPLAI